MIVDDETTDDHVGARCDMAFQPIGGACARNIPPVAPLGDDALEPIFRHDIEEGLAVVVQVLRHGEDSRTQAGTEEARPALGKRPRDKRAAVGVQHVEGDEDRAAAPFRGLWSESAGEKVVARTAA